MRERSTGAGAPSLESASSTFYRNVGDKASRNFPSGLTVVLSFYEMVSGSNAEEKLACAIDLGAQIFSYRLEP